MATIYDFLKIKKIRDGEAESYPPLECPKCGVECASSVVDTAGTVTYVCVGNGHKRLTWRINEDGDMLKGATGNRYYQ